MKEIDRQAIELWGINGLVLMENAGRAVVDFIREELGTLTTKKFLIVCGKGNNGGDGFVIARHLLNHGATAECFLLGKLAELRGDARTNAQILLAAGAGIRELTDITQLSSSLTPDTVVIDAIFGTGLSAPPTGIYAEAIQLLNQSGLYIISVDIPSGVDADTGKVFAPAVRARLTVTMALPKLGLVLYPGKSHTGKLRVADIGIPRNLVEQNARTFLVDGEFVRCHLPQRQPDGHKGTFGTALIVAGSRGFSGAACLAGMAAVRAGAGLVRLAFPRGIANVIETRVLEAVKHPLPETAAETLSSAALTELLQLTATADCIAIGPGISIHPETKNLLLELLPRIDKPLVIDADGINNLVGAKEIIARIKAPLILTPHPGELGRLLGRNPAQVNADRITTACEFAITHNCILALKGAPTVVAAPDGKVYVNPTGNSGLASGGSGDVLTGLIAGLIAQNAQPLQATIAGVFLHGLAADIAVRETTEYSLAASDLLNFIPRAFATVLC